MRKIVIRVNILRNLFLADIVLRLIESKDVSKYTCASVVHILKVISVVEMNVLVYKQKSVHTDQTRDSIHNLNENQCLKPKDSLISLECAQTCMTCRL